MEIDVVLGSSFSSRNRKLIIFVSNSRLKGCSIYDERNPAQLILLSLRGAVLYSALSCFCYIALLTGLRWRKVCDPSTLWSGKQNTHYLSPALAVVVHVLLYN